MSEYLELPDPADPQLVGEFSAEERAVYGYLHSRVDDPPTMVEVQEHIASQTGELRAVIQQKIANLGRPLQQRCEVADFPAVEPGSFNAEFQLDDFHQIVKNYHIRDIRNLPRFFTDSGLASFFASGAGGFCACAVACGLGGGASKLTGDITQIMAQLPPVIESLTGIRFEKLIQQVPALRKSLAKPEPGE